MIAYSPTRKQNKIMLDLSSRGLAGWGGDIDGLIKSSLSIGGILRRIDIAVDDEIGYLNRKRILEHLDSGRVVTYWKYLNEHNKRPIGGKSGNDYGETIYVGSRTGESFMRFYNKLFEVQSKYDDISLDELPSHWFRAEIEFKGKRAEAIGKRWGTFDPAKLMIQHIDFKDLDGKSIPPRRREKTADWWSDFLGTKTGHKIQIPAHKKGLEEIEEWLHKQVSGAIALIHEAKGADAIIELFEKGNEKLEKNSHYQRLIKSEHARQKLRDIKAL